MLIFSLVLFQIVIFGVLIYIMRQVMAKNVVSATKHLQELSQDQEEKQREITRQLLEAEQKAKDIIISAGKEAEDLRGRVVEQTEKERDEIISGARRQSEDIIKQADKSRQVLIGELKQRIKKEAVIKACELIERSLPQEVKEETHRHWLEDFMASGLERMDRLRVPEGLKEVKMVSAFPLAPQQRKDLTKKLKSFLPEKVKFKEDVDAKIIAGIIVTMGSLVIDGSLKNAIQEKAKNSE